MNINDYKKIDDPELSCDDCDMLVNHACIHQTAECSRGKFVWKLKDKVTMKSGQINTFNVVENLIFGNPIIHSFTGDEAGYKAAVALFNELADRHSKPTTTQYRTPVRTEGYYANSNYSVGIINSVTAPAQIVEATIMQRAEPTSEIFQYVKDTLDNKVGCFVGVGNKNGFVIGWSKCNFKGGDMFDRKKALIDAQNRARPKTDPVPTSFKEFNKFFAGRCERYFKSKQIV